MSALHSIFQRCLFEKSNSSFAFDQIFQKFNDEWAKSIQYKEIKMITSTYPFLRRI